MSKSRPGGGRHRRSQSSPGPAYAVGPDSRDFRDETPSFARVVVRRTALTFGGACAFVAFGAATAQASDSNLLDSVTAAVDEATASVEDVQSAVDPTAGLPRAGTSGTDPSGDPPVGRNSPPAREPAPAESESQAQPGAGAETTEQVETAAPASAPDTEPSSASVMSSEGDRERGTEPEPEPEPTTDVARDDRAEPAADAGTTEAGSTEDKPAERDGSAADAEPESLLGDIVSGVTATTAKPLNSLTDVARQLARRDQADDSDTAPSTPGAPADDTPDDSSAEPEPEPASEGSDAPDDDPAASTTERSEASESDESRPAEAAELVHAVTPVVEAVLDEQTANLVGDVTSTLTPMPPSVTEPADDIVSATAGQCPATAPVNDVVESFVVPGLLAVTEPAGTAIGTVVDPAGAVLAGVVNVTPLTGVIDQVGEVLPAVTGPVWDAAEPVGAVLEPVTAAVVPIVEAVNATAAPVLAPVMEIVGTLDPVLSSVLPVLTPVTETLEPITREPAPTSPPQDVPEPVGERVSEPPADEALDPVLVDPGFSPTGNDTAWGLSATDSVGAVSLPAAAGEPSAATPASLTGFAPAGADVSNQIATTTTAGGALAGSGHGAPPAVGSASVGQGSGGDRSSKPLCGAMHVAAAPLIGSMFLRREQGGVAALAESLRQPGVRPD